MLNLVELACDCVGDLASVEASVLNKNLICVHSCHNNPGKKHTFPVAFERIRVRSRFQCGRLQHDSVCIQKGQIRTVTHHSEDKVVENLYVTVGGLYANGVGQYLCN